MTPGALPEVLRGRADGQRHAFLWFAPGTIVRNGTYFQAGPYTAAQVRELCLTMLDALDAKDPDNEP